MFEWLRAQMQTFLSLELPDTIHNFHKFQCLSLIYMFILIALNSDSRVCCVSVLGEVKISFGVYVFGHTAGIPAPIYFGAIIDTTCLKWGQKRCGGIGACRIYNTTAYRQYSHSGPQHSLCGPLFVSICKIQLISAEWSTSGSDLWQ